MNSASLVTSHRGWARSKDWSSIVNISTRTSTSRVSSTATMGPMTRANTDSSHRGRATSWTGSAGHTGPMTRTHSVTSHHVGRCKSPGDESSESESTVALVTSGTAGSSLGGQVDASMQQQQHHDPYEHPQLQLNRLDRIDDQGRHRNPSS